MVPTVSNVSCGVSIPQGGGLRRAGQPHTSRERQLRALEKRHASGQSSCAAVVPDMDLDARRRLNVTFPGHHEVRAGLAYSFRSSVDRACRALCSRTFIADCVVASISATSCVECSSMSRKTSTVRYWSGNCSMHARTVARVCALWSSWSDGVVRIARHDAHRPETPAARLRLTLQACAAATAASSVRH